MSGLKPMGIIKVSGEQVLKSWFPFVKFYKEFEMIELKPMGITKV